MLENIFDALVASTMETDNKRAFVENEGLELMLMMMKSKRSCRTSAIKCVDYARPGAPPRASGSWTSSGSRRRFRLHGQGIRKGARARGWRLCRRRRSARCPWCRRCSSTSRRAPRGTTGSAKFVEDEHAKCDRLAELWAKYSNRVKAVDARLETRTDDTSSRRTTSTWRGSAAGCTRWSAESDLRLRLRHGSRGDPSAVAAADGVTRGGRGDDEAGADASG